LMLIGSQSLLIRSLSPTTEKLRHIVCSSCVAIPSNQVTISDTNTLNQLVPEKWRSQSLLIRSLSPTARKLEQGGKKEQSVAIPSNQVTISD